MLEAKPHVCFEVEKVIGISRDGSYQVQWAPAWVSRVHLIGCEHLIHEYLQQQKVVMATETETLQQNVVMVTEAETRQQKVVAVTEAETRQQSERMSTEAETHPEWETETQTGLLNELSALSDCSLQPDKVSTDPIIPYDIENEVCTVTSEDSRTKVQTINSQESGTLDTVIANEVYDQLPRLNSFAKTSVTTSEWRRGRLPEPDLSGCREKATGTQSHEHGTATVHTSDSSFIGTWNKPQNKANVDSSIICIKREEEDEIAELAHNASPTFKQYFPCDPSLPCDTNKYTDDPIAEDKVDTSTYSSEEPTSSSLRYNRINSTQSFQMNTDIIQINTSHKHFQENLKNRDVNDHVHPDPNRMDEQQYPCSICRKSFMRKRNLDKHVCSTTMDSKPHACSHCNSKFTSSKDLRRHLRMHTGEKPFHCEICGRSFTRKDNLNTHKRVHIAYTCDWCGESFMRESILRQHRPACPLKTISFVQMS